MPINDPPSLLVFYLVIGLSRPSNTGQSVLPCFHLGLHHPEIAFFLLQPKDKIALNTSDDKIHSQYSQTSTNQAVTLRHDSCLIPKSTRHFFFAFVPSFHSCTDVANDQSDFTI